MCKNQKHRYENFSLLSKEELETVDHTNNFADIMSEFQLIRGMNS